MANGNSVILLCLVLVPIVLSYPWSNGKLFFSVRDQFNDIYGTWADHAWGWRNGLVYYSRFNGLTARDIIIIHASRALHQIGVLFNYTL